MRLLLLLSLTLAGCEFLSAPPDGGPPICLAVVMPPPSVVVVDEQGAPAAHVRVELVQASSGKPVYRNDGDEENDGVDRHGVVTGRYYLYLSPEDAPPLRMARSYVVNATRDGLHATADVLLHNTGCNIERVGRPDTLRLMR